MGYVYTTDVVTKMVYVSDVASAYTYGSGTGVGGFKLDGQGTNSASATYKNSPVYARWTTHSDIVYTNFDTSCEYMRVNGGYGGLVQQLVLIHLFIHVYKKVIIFSYLMVTGVHSLMVLLHKHGKQPLMVLQYLLVLWLPYTKELEQILKLV